MNISSKNLSELFQDAELFFDNREFLITVAQFEHNTVDKYKTLEKERTEMLQVLRQLRQFIDANVAKGRKFETPEEKKMFSTARFLYGKLYKNVKLVDKLMLKWVHIVPSNKEMHFKH